MAEKPRSAHIHPGPGFRVRVNFPRPPAELIRALARFPTPEISDLLNRLYAVDPEIRCLTQSAQQIYGPACTVKVFPGDNLMVHKALDVIEPGDVIIVDAGRSRMNAVMGDLVSTKAKHRGAAGFVVDGLVRDLPNIEPLVFPVFARGASPIGPLHRGPGEINYAICCGGVVVNPGDIVIGDTMGVVVVPPNIADELLHRLQSHESASADYLASVRRGDFSNEWVDRVLREHHCPLIRGINGTVDDQPQTVADPSPPMPVVAQAANGEPAPQ
jgi:regulator of RNase E activity RraA